MFFTSQSFSTQGSVKKQTFLNEFGELSETMWVKSLSTTPEVFNQLTPDFGAMTEKQFDRTFASLAQL